MYDINSIKKKGFIKMEKDISGIFNGLAVVTKKSKSGSEYKVLRVTCSDGDKVYVIDNFLSPDQVYILDSLVDNFNNK